jgi:hypothetical protein
VNTRFQSLRLQLRRVPLRRARAAGVPERAHAPRARFAVGGWHGPAGGGRGELESLGKGCTPLTPGGCQIGYMYLVCCPLDHRAAARGYSPGRVVPEHRVCEFKAQGTYWPPSIGVLTHNNNAVKSANPTHRKGGSSRSTARWSTSTRGGAGAW